MAFRAALRAVRSGIVREKEFVLFDFSRVSRPSDVYVLDPLELERKLNESEIEAVKAREDFSRNWVNQDDSGWGGNSQSAIEVSPEEGGKLVFSGCLSQRLSTAQRKQDFERSGFCNIIRRLNEEAASVMDFDAVSLLMYAIVFCLLIPALGKFEIVFKCDKNRYFLNICPESFIPDEMYQGIVAVDESLRHKWTSAIIPFSGLFLSGRGRIKEIQRDFDYRVLESVGISLMGNQEGDFKFELKQMKVINTSRFDPLELRLRSPVGNMTGKLVERFD